MRNLIRCTALILLLITVHSANAAPATSFIVNPCGPFVVQNCAEAIHPLGQPFAFWVIAVDGTNSLATNFTGTVSIASSDPNATLPSNHTFTLADGSVFAFTITLNSLGPNSPPTQMVTAFDSTSGLVGNHNFFVGTASFAAFAIPTLSTSFQLLLGVLLGVLAIFALRSRANAKNS